MRISDWSSDVCSSDLVDVDTGVVVVPVAVADRRLGAVLLRHVELGGGEAAQRLGGLAVLGAHGSSWMQPLAAASTDEKGRRSEERRVGTECVSKVRSRWSPDHEKTNKTRESKTTARLQPNSTTNHEKED